MESINRYGYVVARIMLAAIFLLTGYDKLVDTGDATGDIAEIGLPFPMLLAVVFPLVASLVRHQIPSDQERPSADGPRIDAALASPTARIRPGQAPECNVVGWLRQCAIRRQLEAEALPECRHVL